MGEVNIPLVSTNRINTPEVAEEVLASGQSDMVSMARPFLADADFVNKAAEDKADEINTCIGCNQACLDHVFKQERATCLVNPQACYETELTFAETKTTKRIGVVGAGMAGLAFSVYAAQRGHKIELFEAGPEIGGQFNMAKKIPGKEEFYETMRYFNKQLELHDVKVHLNSPQTKESLTEQGFDEIVVATGIKPRTPPIEGIDNDIVLNYVDVLKHGAKVGKKVAIIGAGGIGFDVAEFLAEEESLTTQPEKWLQEWGIDKDYQQGGALTPNHSHTKAEREIYLLQRKTTKVGAGLGKTTGWIHRSTLKNQGVNMIPGVEYRKVTDNGLYLIVNGEEVFIECNNVVICAGQDSDRSLYDQLIDQHQNVHLIGGADVAAELDAKRAIRQGAELAAKI